jgi:hypothetical protein
MVKYTSEQFKNDLSDLQSMLKEPPQSYKSSGGKKNSGEEIRWFKLVAVDGKELPESRGRYRAYTKKIVKSKLKEVNQTPLDAATRAFSQLCEKKGTDCKKRFTIRETTGGSSKKDYTYDGKKVKLPKKIIVKIKGGKPYTVEYKSVVSKVSGDK